MIDIYVGIGIVFAVLYGLIQSNYVAAWRKIPVFEMDPNRMPTTRISIVIAARNEASNIAACLEAINQNDYPPELTEIILVNDGSTDATASVATAYSATLQYPIHILQHRAPKGKKTAIQTGIQAATGTLILCTDADCEVPNQWISFMVQCYETSGAKLVTGPVQYKQAHNWLQKFQSLDLLGLMGITAAGIAQGWQHMANGANMAYEKAAFEAVGGFNDNLGRASGDDMFLVQKIAARWPGKVVFLKQVAASVITTCPSDLSAFVQQRLRWGTKNKALPEWRIKIVLACVFAYCCWLLTSWLLLLFYPEMAISVLVLAACKLFFDWLLLREVCVFFKRPDLMRRFLPSFFLHTVYIVLIGTASILPTTYSWKGQKMKFW